MNFNQLRAYCLEKSNYDNCMSDHGVFFSDAKNLRNKVTSGEVKLEDVKDRKLLVAVSVISCGCFCRVLIYGLLTTDEILFIMQKIKDYPNDHLITYCSHVMRLLTDSKYLESVKAAIHDIRIYDVIAKHLGYVFKLDLVPQEFMTPEFLTTELFVRVVINGNGNFEHFNELLKDSTFLLSVVEKHSNGIGCIPQEFQTKELLEKYHEKWNYLYCFSSDESDNDESDNDE